MDLLYKMDAKRISEHEALKTEHSTLQKDFDTVQDENIALKTEHQGLKAKYQMQHSALDESKQSKFYDWHLRVSPSKPWFNYIFDLHIVHLKCSTEAKCVNKVVHTRP